MLSKSLVEVYCLFVLDVRVPVFLNLILIAFFKVLNLSHGFLLLPHIFHHFSPFLLSGLVFASIGLMVVDKL